MSLPSGSIHHFSQPSGLHVESPSAPLESKRYELLHLQPLYFHNHPHCPELHPSVVSVLRSQCPLCCAFSYNCCAVSSLQPLAPLFALFPAPLPFVFNHFQPLFPKHPGWGVSPFNPIAADPRRPKVGQPFLAVLRFQVRANSNAQTHSHPKPGGLPKHLAQLPTAAVLA